MYSVASSSTSSDIAALSENAVHIIKKDKRKYTFEPGAKPVDMAWDSSGKKVAIITKYTIHMWDPTTTMPSTPDKKKSTSDSGNSTPQTPQTASRPPRSKLRFL